jgi:hypothetical protein
VADMELRRCESDDPVRVTVREFCELVSRGRVPPEAWYRTPWSGGWHTVDNYPPFHKHSPTRYPVGALMAEETQRKDARQARFDDFLRRLEQTRQLITASYRLRPLSEIGKNEHCAGVSRLTICPTMECRDRIATLAFGDRDITVEIVCSRKPLSWYLPWPPEVENDALEHTYKWARPFGPEDIVRGSRVVPYKRAPKICATWNRFLQYVLLAESCESFAFDREIFGHEMLSGGQVVTAMWRNPGRPECAYQCRVVRAYTKLIQSAGWKDLFMETE